MNTLDIIDKLPGELAARLMCNSYFADIPVVIAEKGNIALELARKEAVITEKGGKRGIAVVVLQLVADDLSNNLQFGPMRYKPAFQIVENVELNNDDNGTGKSARKVARQIRDVIKGCNLMGLVQDMRTATPCIEPVDLSELGAAIVSYQVNFECLEVSHEQLKQVELPQFVAGSDPLNPTFELTCPTPGAEIWFTTDDSFPYNGTVDDYAGSTAQLYSAAVSFTGSVVVRAAGYVDGYIASGVNRATLIVAPV